MLAWWIRRYAAGARPRSFSRNQRADRADTLRPVQDVMMKSQANYRRFRSLLIANRGEIACRVIRTAKAMGLRTVAVYSEADRGAMHVAIADEAVLLGPARARDSYLNIERVIEAARKSGAEAVHPGYGFLSENAEFAQACADPGLVFVGPTAAMMTAMGSRSSATLTAICCRCSSASAPCSGGIRRWSRKRRRQRLMPRNARRCAPPRARRLPR